MPEENTLERLTLAVDALATSTQSIQERLIGAYMAIIPLLEADFSDDESRDKFVGIFSSLRDSGSEVETYCLNLTDDKAQAIAHEIFDLFTTVMSQSIYGVD